MVIKFLIFLALSFISVSVKAQKKLHGTYTCSTGWTNTRITFKRKFTFTYFYSSCTGAQKGTGTYVIKDTLLTLNFENPKRNFISSHPVIQKQTIEGDTTWLYFNFFDQQNQAPVQNIIVKYKSQINGIYYGAICNENGFVKLGLPVTQLPAKVEVNWFAVSKKSVYIDTMGNYKITFPINFNRLQQLEKGDALQFKIDEYNRDELTLREPGETPNRKFIRE